MDPLLIWVGGKSWQVDIIKPLYRRYPGARLVEPFCGGLAVTLGLLPTTALLNDINPYLINLYDQIKRGLKMDPDFSFENTPERYYEVREKFNDLSKDWRACMQGFRMHHGMHPNDLDPMVGEFVAQFFYYLNRTCFRGLCRFNSKGEFNTPFGWRHHESTPDNLPSRSGAALAYQTSFEEYQKIFERWEFVCGDFEKIQLMSDDFLFCDPPYDCDFDQYNEAGFSWDDQRRVAAWGARHIGPVVLTNQATPRILNLYRDLGYQCTVLSRPERMRSRAGTAAGTRQEVVARKNIADTSENIGLFA